MSRTQKALPPRNAAQAYLDAHDRWFHEQTGIRLPDPHVSAEQHRRYDRQAWEILFDDPRDPVQPAPLAEKTIAQRGRITLGVGLASLVLLVAAVSIGWRFAGRHGAVSIVAGNPSTSAEDTFSFNLRRQLYRSEASNG